VCRGGDGAGCCGGPITDSQLSCASNLPNSDSSTKVTFLEQPFTRAFRDGHWLLLDELNLGPDEVLRCIETAIDTGVESQLGKMIERNRDDLTTKVVNLVNPGGEILKFSGDLNLVTDSRRLHVEACMACLKSGVPVLLQGAAAVGKSSLVKALAKASDTKSPS